MNKPKSTYTLTGEAQQMIVELAVDSMKKTGRGNKSNEVEMAVRREYKRRIKK